MGLEEIEVENVESEDFEQGLLFICIIVSLTLLTCCFCRGGKKTKVSDHEKDADTDHHHTATEEAPPRGPPETPDRDRVFTLKELSKYDGTSCFS